MRETGCLHYKEHFSTVESKARLGTDEIPSEPLYQYVAKRRINIMTAKRSIVVFGAHPDDIKIGMAE